MSADAERLASSVRALRTARDWTLDHAAARLGISRRLLAQIEAGQANPSLSTLLGVADGFGVHLTDLLGAEDAAPSVASVQDDPESARVLWSSPAGGAGRLLVGRGALELWHWTLAAGDAHDSNPHSATSMEALHVLEGVVELEVGPQTMQLEAGGSVIFESHRPHAYRNPASQPASFLLTVFDPTAR